MDSYRIEFVQSARKDIRAIDRQWIPKVVDAIYGLAQNPHPAGSKKLIGSERTYRIRVGDYRVIYDVEDIVRVVLITRVRHRKDVYR